MQFGLGGVRNDDKQSRAKIDFQTEESRIESGEEGETLNATVVSCGVALGNAKFHTRNMVQRHASPHGGGPTSLVYSLFNIMHISLILLATMLKRHAPECMILPFDLLY